MIDVNDDITASLDLLRTELQNHNPKLINKPSIILITKTDTINKDQIKSKKQIDSIEMQSISSLNRDGINEAQYTEPSMTQRPQARIPTMAWATWLNTLRRRDPTGLLLQPLHIICSTTDSERVLGLP